MLNIMTDRLWKNENKFAKNEKAATYIKIVPGVRTRHEPMPRRREKSA